MFWRIVIDSRDRCQLKKYSVSGKEGREKQTWVGEREEVGKQASDWEDWLPGVLAQQYRLEARTMQTLPASGTHHLALPLINIKSRKLHLLTADTKLPKTPKIALMEIHYVNWS